MIMDILMITMIMVIWIIILTSITVMITMIIVITRDNKLHQLGGESELIYSQIKEEEGIRRTQELGKATRIANCEKS